MSRSTGLAFGTTPAKTMCSGPFKPVSYVKGARTTLDAVPNYWDTAQQPKIKSITFTTVNDAEALIAGLRSGSINGTFDLPARDALSLSGDSSLKVNYVPYGGDVNYLSPNVEKGPFKNPLVREAFNLAIPRSALATAVDGKYGRPLDLVETPALFTDHQSQYMAAYNALGVPNSPNLTKAKQLIAKAGAKGETVNIAIEQSLTSDTVGAELQQVGSSIGLNVKMDKLTPAAFGNVSYSGKCPRNGRRADQLVEPRLPGTVRGTRAAAGQRLLGRLLLLLADVQQAAQHMGGDQERQHGTGQRDHRPDEAGDQGQRVHPDVLGSAGHGGAVQPAWLHADAGVRLSGLP